MKGTAVQCNACALSHVQLSYDHMDCSPSGISVHGIFPARILQWVAISSSRGSSQPRGRIQGSCVSWTGRQILYHWTIWKAQVVLDLGSNTSCAIYNMSLNKELKPSFPWFPYCILYSVSAPSPVLLLRWIPVAGKRQGPPIERKWSRSVVSDSLWPHGIVARQAPLSMGFSRQEYWSGLPFLPPGDIPEPGTETGSLAPAALAGKFFTTAPPGKPVATSSVALGKSLQLSEPQLLHQ